VHDLIVGGALGRVHTVYGTATGWMMHMLSHLIDYTLWFNPGAKAQWVMAQAAGRGKLADSHPSPDYIAGFIHFSNGVHGVIECGAGAPDVPEVPYWWRKCRIGAQGTDGFAEVMTGGGWRAVTKTGSFSGEGSMNYDLDMPPTCRKWPIGWTTTKGPRLQFHTAWEGFEIMMALCRSVIEGGQIALPLTTGMDEIAALKEKCPRAKFSFPCRKTPRNIPVDRSGSASVEAIIRPDQDSAALLVARLIARELRANPSLVLGLATGRTMEAVYRILVRMHREEGWIFPSAALSTSMNTSALPRTMRAPTATT
jgi:hypothetical protein